MKVGRTPEYPEKTPGDELDNGRPEFDPRFPRGASFAVGLKD